MEPWQIALLMIVLVVGAIVLYLRSRARPQLPPKEEEPRRELPKPAEKPSAKKPEAAPEKKPEPAVEKKAEAAPETKVEEPARPVAEVPREEAKETKPTAPVAEPAPPAPTAPVTAPVAGEAPPVEAVVAKAPSIRPPSMPPKARDAAAVKRGLAPSRAGFMDRLFAVFSGKKEIDPALIEQMEEALLTGDVGTATTQKLVDGIRQRLDRKELSDPSRVWDALRDDARTMLSVESPAFGSAMASSPLVILMVGVNGAGKTTTTAKLAGRYRQSGQKVLLAAADTFRAAAVQQLEMWGQRVGVPVYKGREGAKPSAVVYEAVAKAVAEGFEVVIADTAGRLQNKAPLMEELRKTRDAAGKAHPGAPHEILLVLDAVTGQNALSQAKEFRQALEVTGVVLTKLDGTAKGGVILAVADEFKLPVRFIGVGEKADDLRDFDAPEFVDALFAREEGAEA